MTDYVLHNALAGHPHLSSKEISSGRHARPLPTEGPIPTVEQDFFPQGNISKIEDPTSLDGFDEELEPLWNSVNSSRSPFSSLQPLPGTYSRDLSLARGIQESTNSNTMDLSPSTGSL